MAGKSPAGSMLKSTNPYHVGYDQKEDIRLPDEQKTHTNGSLSGTYLVKQPQVLVGVIPAGRDYMMWSILACIFCFMPTGIAAVYYANKANNDLETGSIVDAEMAQRQSKKFIIISVIIGSALLLTTSITLGVLYEHGHI